MAKKIIQVKIVAGASVDDDKILIIQRSAEESFYPNRWELPSGRREPLEPTEKAALREIKEETGLDVEIVNILNVFDYQIERGDEIRDATQISFLAKLTGKQNVKLSMDHQNFAWIGFDEINDYNITKETKEVVKKALETC